MIIVSAMFQYDNGERDQVSYSMVQPLNPFSYGGGSAVERGTSKTDLFGTSPVIKRENNSVTRKRKGGSTPDSNVLMTRMTNGTSESHPAKRRKSDDTSLKFGTEKKKKGKKRVREDGGNQEEEIKVNKRLKKGVGGQSLREVLAETNTAVTPKNPVEQRGRNRVVKKSQTKVSTEETKKIESTELQTSIMALTDPSGGESNLSTLNCLKLRIWDLYFRRL